jgi:putative hydrolase of the HAD superfamily
MTAVGRVVCFDCWNTVLRERGGSMARAVRAHALADALGLSRDEGERWLAAAWERHVAAWTAGEAFASREMVRWVFSSAGVVDPQREARVVAVWEDAALAEGAELLPGVGSAIATLRQAGFRVAMVCDTGFSPGRVVRQLVAAHGLSFDAWAFSDEVGLPKPAAAMFHAALTPFGVAPAAALHVGDLRRTDVAGGRAAGLRTVRYRGAFDDPAPLPEADWVIDDHGALPAIATGVWARAWA